MFDPLHDFVYPFFLARLVGYYYPILISIYIFYSYRIAAGNYHYYHTHYIVRIEMAPIQLIPIQVSWITFFFPQMVSKRLSLTFSGNGCILCYDPNEYDDDGQIWYTPSCDDGPIRLDGRRKNDSLVEIAKRRRLSLIPLLE